MKKRPPKTTGLEWLEHSVGAFNGSGYADRSSAEAFYQSYYAYKSFRKDTNALSLASQYYSAVMPLCEHLANNGINSHIPSDKNLAKFYKFRLDNSV